MISWANYEDGNTLGIIRNKINSFSTAVAAAVNSNTTDIAALKTKATFVPSYDYIQGNSITVTGATYEQIARLTTPSREAGIYKMSQSMMYSLNSTATSAYFRYSTNGGGTWNEIRREPKDNTDVLPSTYTTTIVHPGGVFELVIQAKKENALDILTVLSIDATFERKV